MPAGAVVRDNVAVDLLDLDPENPRVIIDAEATQDELLEYLYFRESLDELVPSFLESGYFIEEPLVAVKAAGRRYRVVEGNRRLATLKLLLDEKAQRRIGVTGWPRPTPEQKARLATVPVVVHPNRADVVAFLGYRHITGAKKWAPFQKSRFVAQLVEAGEDITRIQDLIGDSTQAVKKLYQEYVVFRQIVEELELDPEPIRTRFSLLEVTLGQRPIKTYLGMSRSLPRSATDTVVPEDHLEQLEEVVGWVFGTASQLPVISESRDINQKLAKILADENATSRLRETSDLDLAYDLTDGEQQSLLRQLSRAERAIQQAAQTLPLYKDDGDIKEAIRRLATLVGGLRKQLR